MLLHDASDMDQWLKSRISAQGSDQNDVTAHLEGQTPEQ